VFFFLLFCAFDSSCCIVLNYGLHNTVKSIAERLRVGAYRKFCLCIYCASVCASAVFGVVILSIHLSITRVDCDKTKWCTLDILVLRERAIILLLWH